MGSNIWSVEVFLCWGGLKVATFWFCDKYPGETTWRTQQQYSLLNILFSSFPNSERKRCKVSAGQGDGRWCLRGHNPDKSERQVLGMSSVQIEQRTGGKNEWWYPSPPRKRQCCAISIFNGGVYFCLKLFNYWSEMRVGQSKVIFNLFFTGCFCLWFFKIIFQLLDAMMDHRALPYRIFITCYFVHLLSFSSAFHLIYLIIAGKAPLRSSQEGDVLILSVKGKDVLRTP